METLKFKVGDKVRVKSLEWYYGQVKNEDGEIEKGMYFTAYMCDYCDSILTIKKLSDRFYLVEENNKYWQDWMLEDKPVTEKQEVEQLNKNDMREKEMTKEEARMLLNNKKIACFSKEETIAVQEKLLETGFVWIDSTRKVYDDTFLIFTREDGFMCSTDNIKCWLDDCMKKIETSEILAIQIKEENQNLTPKPCNLLTRC